MVFTQYLHRGGFSGGFVRWLLAHGAFSVPQAAGPIAFTLLAMPLTGNAGSGAALVLAITLAQVAGAVPLSRFGRRWNPVVILKLLVGFRGLAFAALALLAQAGAPFAVLLAVAAAGGVVNGAAFGFLRAILNDLVEKRAMPRALGMAATLNETIFVAAPVAASVLGTVLDPVTALLLLVALGTAPVILLPAMPHAAVDRLPVGPGGGLLRPGIVLWLGCTLATSSAVAAVEIGAVAIAIGYGMAPAEGAVFAVALCAASVVGGVWVSARNRVPGHRAVPVLLLTMGLGTALVAAGISVAATLAGAVVIGLFLAPMGTYYSLRLDALAPAPRRAEVFALARTAHALGIIVASAGLTLASLEVALGSAAALLILAAAVVGGVALRGR